MRPYSPRVSDSNTVYVVHCIDTEGPLYESMEATFERLNSIFHLHLKPSEELLRRLQTGTVDLSGKEAAVRQVVDPRLLAYNDTWEKVDAMLADALSERFRSRVLDSEGGGWVYNWFCVDHVDYESNPRRRDVGYHNVYDHYRSVLHATDSWQDGVHFHFHPHSFQREAHRCATHWWASSNSLHQILCRRVVDRHWFPAANRPGFNAIRPDSHWFLEQFIPFDYSSQAMAPTEVDGAQFGVSDGRFGDWRRAPRNWQPYHPAGDDYQMQGTCRRWIARCLSVGTRHGLLTEFDVRQAFREAQAGKPTILAFTNHDFRDLRPDVEAVSGILVRVSAEFPDVSFRFSEAVDAMRHALSMAPASPCELDLSLRSVDDRTDVLEVRAEPATFGPQPWLALKTSDGTYHHDNFDIHVPFRRWQYVFDEETFPLRAVAAIGVAANNASGMTTVAVMNPSTRTVSRKYWNQTGTVTGPPA
ncbi:MAG: hypothetical protein L0387_36700 [Acidobacteria bacterium]|nr:hypothetical protein [Acidobacteriota bacterium]